MSLASISVKRYVFAAMLNLAIVLFGIVAYQDIGVERVPNIDFAKIQITTRLLGANPENIDVSITNVLEGAVASIPAIDELVSTSSPGQSVITPSFDLGKDIDIAFNEVQAKVSEVLRLLPDQADPPIITKTETSAFPVFWLTIIGNRTLQQLNQIARGVKKKLETVDGVGSIIVGGLRPRTIRINLDLDQLTAFGITVQDIIAAFRNEHIQLPGGYLVDAEREELLKLDLEYHHPEDLEGLILGYRDGGTIYLRDVAVIEDGLSDNRTFGRFNTEPGIGLGIVKIAGRNTVEISREIKRRLNEDVIPQLPPGVQLFVSNDDSEYILQLIASMEEHLFAGAIFAALVVWFFLRSVRATLIVSAAIPVSLLGAVLVMYFLDYTLNVVTMLALLILIGVVVDDAIVVLENIQRRLEAGEKSRVNASIEGTNQVLLAIVASTLTLAAIFTVVLFMDGIPGKLFRAFGVVVACGVLVSLFVSITLTPMLCSRYVKVEHHGGPVYTGITRTLNGLDHQYRAIIAWTLGHRWKVLLAALLIVLLTPVFFFGLGGEFFPPEDEGSFQVIVKTPLGSSLAYGSHRMAEVEKTLLSFDDVATAYATMGRGRSSQVTEGTIYASMVPSEQRQLKQYELMPLLREKLEKLPGVRAFPSAFTFTGSARGEALNFALTGPDLESVARLSRELLDRLSTDPEMGNFDLDLNLDLPQTRLTVDRELAAEFGLSTLSIAEAANVLAGGLNVAKFSDEPGDGERYDIRLKAAGDFNLADMSKIYLRTPNRALVRLDSVAAFKQNLGPAVISRLDRQYAAYFYSDPTISLGDAIKRLNSVAADVLPPGYSLQMLGRAKQLGNTSNSLGFAFLLSLVLVYMVLASQFNSYSQPLIIMVAQPLAVIGGIAALNLFDHTLNVFSMTGLVLLIGLVAKNSILLVDRTNQLRDEGMAIDEALLEACPMRLRPILMTSFTIIFAMMVPALGLGAGVELSAPMAVAVVGGMVTSTLLSLVVVPAVYSLVENVRVQRAARIQTTESV
ncbi:MAG: acriflavin resistance protein [Chromatiales bacterium]|nr:acriflavin resistance protein [Chromatiales bacterium]